MRAHALRLLVPALASAVLALPAAPRQEPYVTDPELREAWSGLRRAEQIDVLEYLRSELSYTESLQLMLVRYVIAAAQVDPGLWPRATSAPFYDPTTHAPAQAIPRRALASDDARVVRERARLLAGVPERRLDSAWDYDWSSGNVVLVADDDAPERVFANALAGFPPDLDYAEALVMRMLDDGSQRAALAAFGHAYCDRNGAVLSGITLYDAWASGESIEMPDVDTLGIVHDVLGDWSTWVAPVSPFEQDALYDRIGEVFSAAQRHRGLRTALARAYLTGSPVLRDGYPDALNRLHAIWEDAQSRPETLRERLPGPDAWSAYLEDWGQRYQRSEEVREAALARRRMLDAGGALVRATLVRVMKELGALDPEPVAAPAEAVAWEPLAPELEQQALAALRALPRKRADLVLERCRAAARASGAPQVELVRAVTARFAGDPARLPPPTVHGAFEPRDFGGGPDRRVLRAGDERFDALAARIAREPAPSTARSADYELATGRVVGLASDAEDGNAELARLLRGVLPGLDLAEAVLLMELDGGGGLREEGGFFAHLYADRDGNAYAGITLLDAWSSPIEVEVPDPDACAFARLVWSGTELRRPLSDADQRLWYPRIGAAHQSLRRGLLLSRALAGTWLRGRPELSRGYQASVDTLHALLALEEESVERVRARLADDGQDFLGRALSDLQERGDAAWQAGQARRDRLLAGEAAIRAAVLAVLREEQLLTS